MKIHKHLFRITCAVTIIFAGCKQSYNPPAITTSKNYLVVDGFINAGTDSTIFTLSRTANLDSVESLNPELGAQLIVQGSNGYSTQLPELGNGRYGTGGLSLASTQNYRLSIATSNGAEYLSDYTPVKASPQIDSISWQLNDSGVAVYANTHDPLNNTHYYRWDYAETWEYHSLYDSYFHYDPASRTVFENSTEVPHICWNSDNSNYILIASSIKLNSDIIYRAPLTVIPLNSDKISVQYSILVRQHALTAEEYDYWQALQSSTEQTGSLFDQQPSQITGNIKCISNPQELAIGYIGAGSLAESRIFIKNSQVAPWYLPLNCPQILYPPNPDSLEAAVNFGLLPIGMQMTGAPSPGYYFSNAPCVDCTLMGGTTAKPSFW